MEVRFRADVDRATTQFTQVRKQLNAKVKEGLTEGATRHALPQVLRRSPSVTRPFLTAKATTRGAYITTKGSTKGDRITGLLNFGGTVNTPIFAKPGSAIMTPWGPRSVVYRGSRTGTKPAVYKGKHFIETGVAASVSGMEDALMSSVLESFDEFAE